MPTYEAGINRGTQLNYVTNPEPVVALNVVKWYFLNKTYHK